MVTKNTISKNVLSLYIYVVRAGIVAVVRAGVVLIQYNSQQMSMEQCRKMYTRRAATEKREKKITFFFFSASSDLFVRVNNRNRQRCDV